VLIVTVKPPGREEYALTLDGEPTYSAAQFGGYEAATIPCQLDDEQRLHCLGAKVRIHGTGWEGIVLRRPSVREPLIARGKGWCAALDKSKALFTKSTGILDECYEWDVTGSEHFRRYKTEWGLVAGIEAGETPDTNDNAGWMYLSDVPLGSIGFNATVNNANITLKVQGIDASATLNGSALTITASANTQSLTFAAGTYGFTMRALVESGGSEVTTFTQYAAITSIKLYGVDSSTTPNGIINAILDAEVDTQFLAAGAANRVHIGAPATTIDPLEFDTTTAEEKIAEVAKFDAYDYGWYTRLIGGLPVCVPHYTARSTTPDYIIRLEEAEDDSLDEASLDELYSDVIVHHADSFGNPRSTRVTGTSQAYPLVKLGITRTASIDIQCVSTVTATNRGTLFLADRARAQVKGSVTTRYVRDANGADVYLPDIRPGRMARVTLPDGYVDAIIKRVECIGDAVATIELDNADYRLDQLLARRRGNT
jgi:hypothetical protein